MYGRALAVGSLVVAAAIAGSSDATASRPALTITSTPAEQTLETTVVGRIDAQTNRPVFALRFGTATFKVTVKNSGDVDLADVTVDAASPACDRSIGALAVGESISYVCRIANIGRNLTNRLTASGSEPDAVGKPAGLSATAATTATVTVKRPTETSGVPHFNLFRKKRKAKVVEHRAAKITG